MHASIWLQDVHYHLALMAKLQEVLSSPASWAVLGAALFLPFAWPLLALLLPVAAFALLSNKASGDPKVPPAFGAPVAAPTKAQVCRFWCMSPYVVAYWFCYFGTLRLALTRSGLAGR